MSANFVCYGVLPHWKKPHVSILPVFERKPQQSYPLRSTARSYYGLTFVLPKYFESIASTGGFVYIVSAVLGVFFSAGTRRTKGEKPRNDGRVVVAALWGSFSDHDSNVAIICGLA